MKKELIIYTTADTKKEYVFDKGNRDANRNISHLWEASITLNRVDIGGYVQNTMYETVNKKIFLERETLENAGLKPMAKERVDAGEQPTETTEDLIIRLLEHLGFYPNGEGDI